MDRISDFQIPDLLTVAKCRLAYCSEIISYLKDKKGEFKNNCPVGVFYINLHNMAFNEALLIVIWLLKNPRKNDKRVINLWNYQKLSPKILDILISVTECQEFKNLSLFRDQVIGHQDVNNRSNMFPRDRMGSRISSSYVEGLEQILNLCIQAYCICVPSFTEKSYINDEWARFEIKTMLEKAVPELQEIN